MTAEQAEEVVPGMAEAIDARRKHLGLSPGEFASRSGLTRQGLVPVRKGYRRQYQDKLKLGVARALQWPPDAIDRLMAGEDPATFTTDQPTPPGGAAAQRPLGLAALAESVPAEKRAQAEAYLRGLIDGAE